MKKSNYLLIGHILAPFGIKGEMKVSNESDTPEDRYQKNKKVYLKKNDEYYEVKISSVRFHKNMPIITLNDIYDINYINDFLGLDIYIDKTKEPELVNQIYVDDLIGLKVINQYGEELGIVKDVLELPGNSILEINLKNNKKMLIPFVKEYIKEITLDTIFIDEIEGLR